MDEPKQEMFVEGLPVPHRLVTLINRGLWPKTEKEALRQNIRSFVPKERIQLFAPEEDRIFLVWPPFRTVSKIRSNAERRGGGEEKFWSSSAAPEGLSPALSVFIGDFGLGSDSPILLDYREDRFNPTVIRLQWRKGLDLPNIWVRCADSFDEFADMLGLEAAPTSPQKPLNARDVP